MGKRRRDATDPLQVYVSQWKDVSTPTQRKRLGPYWSALDGVSVQTAVVPILVGMSHAPLGVEHAFSVPTATTVLWGTLEVRILVLALQSDEDDVESYTSSDKAYRAIKMDNRPLRYDYLLTSHYTQSVVQTAWLLMSWIKPKTKISLVGIVRHMTAMCNAKDNEGLLYGRWDDSYGEETAPSKWKNVADICDRYLETRKPVKYAQCWVFAAAVCAMFRCLGLPCRSVANFDSFHDEDGDGFVDEDEYTWNYHVWNEVWMGEWYVVDATPQEPSKISTFCVCEHEYSHQYVCGPVTRKQVKECRPLKPGIQDYLTLCGKTRHAKILGRKRYEKSLQSVNGLMTAKDHKTCNPDAFFISASVCRLAFDLVPSHRYRIEHGTAYVYDLALAAFVDITHEYSSLMTSRL